MADLVIIIGCILVALSVHEMMHALVGYKLGDVTAAEQGRISLNPLRHIDPFMTVLLPAITLFTLGAPILAAKPVPFNPEYVKWDDYGAALIAVAGPLSNLVMAFLAALALHYMPSAGTGLTAQILTTFIGLNASLFVFNLVPIPPLDGSRVLYAFAPDGLRRLMEQIEPVGLFVVFGMVLLGFGSFIGHWTQLVLNILP